MLNQQERPTMTVKEAAAHIGVSPITMYNLTESTDCNFLIRIGRKKLILRERLMTYLERQADANAGHK